MDAGCYGITGRLDSPVTAAGSAIVSGCWYSQNADDGPIGLWQKPRSAARRITGVAPVGLRHPWIAVHDATTANDPEDRRIYRIAPAATSDAVTAPRYRARFRPVTVTSDGSRLITVDRTTSAIHVFDTQNARFVSTAALPRTKPIPSGPNYVVSIYVVSIADSPTTYLVSATTARRAYLLRCSTESGACTRAVTVTKRTGVTRVAAP